MIEQVMDKETYKVACDILNRFGDASTRAQHQPVATGMWPFSQIVGWFLVNEMISSVFLTGIASPNQSIIGSNLATPQKQPTGKVGLTPQNLQRQAIMPVPTARTPINVRSMPQSSSLVTPSYGQYRLTSPNPTPVVGKL